MNCDDVRLELLPYQWGQLSTLHQHDIRAHLEACSACAHEVTADALLTEALERRLPQHAAPLGFKRRLAAQWPSPSPLRPSWWARWRLSLLPALATVTVLLIAVPIYYGQIGPFQSDRSASMVTEAVTNHLRLLSSQHPLDIESGNMHQVKPWYEGRLDFAPVVPFLGDQEFPTGRRRDRVFPRSESRRLRLSSTTAHDLTHRVPRTGSVMVHAGSCAGGRCQGYRVR